MGLVPEVVDDLLPDLTEEELPTQTYAMVLDQTRIRGKCEGTTALKQAIYKIVNTERYDYPVYSESYGIELKDLLGKPQFYCMAELERRIKEALLQDDRIDAVNSFTFKVLKKGKIQVSFKVTSGTKETEATTEVTV